MRISVFDVSRREWRSFDVVPDDPTFRPRCGNALHQFEPTAGRCACGAQARLLLRL